MSSMPPSLPSTAAKPQRAVPRPAGRPPGRSAAAANDGVSMLTRDEPARAEAPSNVAAKPHATPRAFTCRCGRPVFFRNSECLACRTPLGYDPEVRALLPVEPAVEAGAAGNLWRHCEAGTDAPRYRRCSNLGSAAACNWLVAESDPLQLCRCCRLTRTLPDLSIDNDALWWNRIEVAKRRLVSSLIGLRLPVRSKMNEDPSQGMVFDLLRATPGSLPVVTGHADGVITLDVEEADDAWREQRRAVLAEPYRTLLGHLRHECGHYYWQRLVDGTDWIGPFRGTFGDERRDYTAALKSHYQAGPPPDWGTRYVSAYASTHPWEDWAETWAHYLHLVDTLDTARSFGVDGENVELSYERYGPDVVAGTGDPHAAEFLHLINGWMELTGVLNELSRSMGVPDFYPFVLSVPAVRKLHLVHRVITTAADRA